MVRIGNVFDDGFERRDCARKVVLAVVDEAYVEADSRDLRSEILGMVEHIERLTPLLSAHVNDSEVGVSTGDSWVERDHLTEGVFSVVEVVILQGSFALVEELLGVGLGRRRLLRRKGSSEGNKSEQCSDQSKDASQTRGFAVAKNASDRAARPGSSLRNERSLRMTRLTGSKGSA